MLAWISIFMSLATTFAVLIPGSNESFTVKKYKHFLNKPYSKINLLFIWKLTFNLWWKIKIMYWKTMIMKINGKILKAGQGRRTSYWHYYNLITTEDHNEAATYLLKIVHKAVLLKMIAINYLHHLLNKTFLI